jgi:hypothetical protein
MTLKQWQDNGWLHPHQTSRQEIENLLAIVDRDLHDAASSEISTDWQFGIAYNAALKLCTILLYAEGYRAATGLQHYRTIQAMSLILGDSFRKDVVFLDACRKKRNIVEYDAAGMATEKEAKELREFTVQLKRTVLDWLKENHPEFL